MGPGKGGGGGVDNCLSKLQNFSPFSVCCFKLLANK